MSRQDNQLVLDVAEEEEVRARPRLSGLGITFG